MIDQQVRIYMLVVAMLLLAIVGQSAALLMIALMR
jgi:hypothetical protein